MNRVAALAFALAATLASADSLVAMPTRPGVKVGWWMMERPGAAATLVLLPGGAGGIAFKDGEPRSTNFLVRTRDLFAAQGFNVAVLGKPSDHDDMDLAFRASAEAIEDLRVVATRLKREYKVPVWLVGTSRGTVSAAAAAAALDPSIVAGIVLTSSITYSKNYPAVPTLPLANVKVPVLVMHHKRDACKSCDPRDAPAIVERLVSSPRKELMIVDGGGGAHGDPCEPMHYHGYIGMEADAVQRIADWIRSTQK